MFQKNGLAENDTVVECFFDVEDDLGLLFLLDQLLQRKHYVLTAEVKINVFLFQLLQLFFGG